MSTGKTLIQSWIIHHLYTCSRIIHVLAYYAYSSISKLNTFPKFVIMWQYLQVNRHMYSSSTILLFDWQKKIYHKMDTSTDVDPRNPKSWSLNGSDLRSSAVSWRNLAMISFWYLELVATVIGYHTWTRSVCNKQTQTRVLIKPCTTRCVFICTCTCTYTAALDDTYLLKFQCTLISKISHHYYEEE